MTCQRDGQGHRIVGKGCNNAAPNLTNRSSITIDKESLDTARMTPPTAKEGGVEKDDCQFPAILLDRTEATGWEK